MNSRTQSGTHKNNTATDKEADPNRKRYFEIVKKYNVGVGRRRHLTKIYCKSKKIELNQISSDMGLRKLTTNGQQVFECCSDDV
jgi:hypothetical protein